MAFAPKPMLRGARPGIRADDWWNGLRTGLGDNSNALIAAGTALMAGDVAGAGRGFVAGAQVDDAYATAQKEKARRETALQAAIGNLRDKYNRPDLADFVDSGGYDAIMPAWEALIKGQQGGGIDPTSDIQNYEYGLANPGFRDWQTQRGGASEISLTPTWGIDEDPDSPTYNQQVLGQLGKDGRFHRTDMGGVRPIDPAMMAGNKKGATVDAETAAAARAALPAAKTQLDTTLAAIDLVANDEAGLNEWFGQFGPRGVYVHPGSRMGTWAGNFTQSEGQAFLQARQFLKGQGAITEIESYKAELAYSRMAAAKEKGDKQSFLQAAADFKAAVESGYANIQALAGGAYSEGALYGAAPAPGGVRTTSTGVTYSVGQ